MKKVAGVTKSEQIKDLLTARISGMAAGDALPSEPKLAREYEVSRFTISRAISELTAAGKLDRVQGKGTFVRKEPAGTPELPASPASMRIGLVFGEGVGISGGVGFYDLVYYGILDNMQLAGYSMVNISVWNTEEDWGAIKLILEKDRLEGLLLVGKVNTEVYERLHWNNIPFIIIDRNLEDARYDSVGTMNSEGVADAVKYLIARGHRRIAFASSAMHTSYTERYKGYRRAMSDAGIEIPDAYLILRNLDELVSDALLGENAPTAIITSNDWNASRVIHIARECGVKVPEDLSVIGFDDDPIAETLYPPLTSLRVSRREMGNRASEILLARLENSGGQPEVVRMPVKLIERKSVCDCGKDASKK